jgi:macrolide phosphotransferase
MGKSPLILAALAKDAVPSLDFVQVRPMRNGSGGSFDTALLTAKNGNLYVLREPNNPTAETKMATELAVLKGMNSAVRSRLPFEIAQFIGETKDPTGSRAVLFSYVYGNPIDISAVNPNGNLAGSIAAATAAIHNLPLALVEGSGLPEYSPSELIKHRIVEFDAAMQTGKVPAVVLDRWQSAFEDINLFRFQPTVVHGDLNSETMLELDGSISGVLAWSSLRISDPAEDLAWLMTPNPNDDLLYNILLGYQNERGNADVNLRQRATLYNEFLIARWLLHGYQNNDENIIEDAVSLLTDLVADIESGNAPSLAATGFQPTSQPAAASGLQSTETAGLEIVEVGIAETSSARPKSTDDELF